MRRRLAFVSIWNSADPNVESGYSYSMRQQLQKSFEVEDIFPLKLPFAELWYPLRAAYKTRKQYYHPMREPSILKGLASVIESRLIHCRPDVIFAPSSIPMTFVQTQTPWIFATDQVFRDFHVNYIVNPAHRFIRLGDAQEAQALHKAAGVSFPSNWAADSAVSAYLASREKICVIPWGANLPHVPERNQVLAAIENRELQRCRLIFLGRDWHRKGGQRLVETVNALNGRGIQTKAAIVGCSPPGLDPQYFEIYGLLNKHDPKDNSLLASLMLKGTFFFLASHAEAYGQAFCEAAAYGLPSIATQVGGIPTIVQTGKTGYLLDRNTKGDGYADVVANALANRGLYMAMAKSAREDFEQRLNWDTFGDKLTCMLNRFV